MSEDAALLQAWVAGDEAAGRDLFGRYYPVLVRFFANKAGVDALELVQQTFTRCVESHARFEGRSSFRAFLLGIARNVFFKHLRTRYKRDRVDFGVTSLTDFGPSPSTDFARKEQERRLLLALQRIPLEQQTLLELFFWENLQGKELAAIYDVPEGTIRSRLASARARLAVEFASLGGAGSSEGGEELDDFEGWAAGVRQQFAGSESDVKPLRA